jgi:hypothetical protein
LVRGDLDWIVMKALEKDRTRRYETANGLAADIQRHLNNEPVLAHPAVSGDHWSIWPMCFSQRGDLPGAEATLKPDVGADQAISRDRTSHPKTQC